MAGSPLRDAFRARLATHASTAGISWPIEDLTNTGESPDVPDDGFIALDFPGGAEEQYSFGAPGNNLHRETGQVSIAVKTRLGAGTTTRDLAETYASALRGLFRSDRFSAGALTIRITATAAFGGGHDEGGLWVESIALGYETFPRG